MHSYSKLERQARATKEKIAAPLGKTIQALHVELLYSEIVDVGDGEALAKALSILENDHERHVACGLAARNYAVAHYALERITRITEDCYLEQLTIQDSDRGGAFSS